MTNSGRGTLTVKRYPLSAQDQTTEVSILATLAKQRTSFTGSPRDGYDLMTSMTPIETGMALEKLDSGSVNGWWVRPQNAPPDRAILLIHGGAYLVGSATGYRGFASQVASRTGVATFALDYPLAPEHPFPAAYDAAVEALRWLCAQGFSQVALVGDSAGGGLVLATLGSAVSTSSPVASAVVFSPWVDLTLSGDSFHDPATHDPLFEPAFLAMAASKRFWPSIAGHPLPGSRLLHGVTTSRKYPQRVRCRRLPPSVARLRT